MEGTVTAPVPAPTLISPTNGGTTTSRTPTFVWENTRPADDFQIQIDDDASFASPVIDTTLTEKQYTSSAELPDKVYYWRVKMTRTGVSSSWSEIMSFSVNAGPALPESTALSIDPSSFTLGSGESRTLTATLTSSGSPLTNKTVTWSAVSGTLGASSGTTNSSGQVSVTYTAPSVTTQTSVTITASFAGDASYQLSSGSSAGTVTVAVLPSTTLLVSPSSFTLSGSGSTNLTATLASSGALLSGKTVTWSVTSGSLSAASSTTNSSGQASVTYTAPSVTTQTSVTITASFAGDVTYLDSNATSVGTVLPQETAQVLENLKENLATQASQLEIQVENAQIQALENAFANGNLGACITVTAELGAPKIEFKNPSLDNVVVSVKSGERVEVTVSSAIAGGKTVLLSVDSQTIPTIQPGGISVLYDNVEVGPADDYVDVLDPTNENVPEYLVLFGAKGAQVLVSIPHFSTHTITILSVPPSIPLIYIAIAVVLIATVLAVVIGRRSRGAEVQEAPAPPLLVPAPPPPSPPPPAPPSQKFQG